jgi:serine/threonine protein kinase
MAPERFDGWSNPRSDLYALGVTLYEMLALRPPFEAPNQIALIEQILHKLPTPLRQIDRNIPRDLETIVHKAMAREPGERYASAEALAEDLRRFLDHRTILARRSTPSERFARWCQRNPALAATGAAIALLLIVSTILAVFSARKSSELAEQRGEQVRRTVEVAQLLKNERDMAVKSRKRAEAAEDEAQKQLFGALIESQESNARSALHGVDCPA